MLGGGNGVEKKLKKTVIISQTRVYQVFSFADSSWLPIYV